MRDIYDSSPAPVSVNLPATEPLHLTGIDFAFLAVSSLTVLVLSLGGWLLDGTVSLFIALGGGLVVFESWHTALMFLQRHFACRAFATVCVGCGYLLSMAVC